MQTKPLGWGSRLTDLAEQGHDPLSPIVRRARKRRQAETTAAKLRRIGYFNALRKEAERRVNR